MKRLAILLALGLVAVPTAAAADEGKAAADALDKLASDVCNCAQSGDEACMDPLVEDARAWVGTYSEHTSSDATATRIQKAAEMLTICAPELAVALVEEMQGEPIALPDALQADLEAACARFAALGEALKIEHLTDRLACETELGQVLAACGPAATEAGACLREIDGDSEEAIGKALVVCLEHCSH